MKQYNLSIVALLMLRLSTLSGQPEVRDLETRFVFGTLVTASCHASTIEEVDAGRLLAAWFGGSQEGAKDVGIYMSDFDGASWSLPRQVVPPLVRGGDTLPCWNPVLYRSQQGQLYLFYKIGKNPMEWYGVVRTSQDGGAHWSEPTDLPEGFLGPVRNKPVEVTPGVIVCGSSTEDPDNNDWRVHVERYYEAEDRWERVTVPNPGQFDIIQPTLLRHGGNTLQMLCRSKHGKLVESWSADAGGTWSAADTTDVLNSNSGVDAVRLPSGGFLLVNNPLRPGQDWWNGRNVLDLAHSPDGTDWQTLIDLERHEDGEYSYPAIIQTSDGRVHITYTYDRRKIRHVSLRVE